MLTEVQIKKAKAAEKPYKLSDSKGLFLLVSNSGSKLWRFRYQRDGKEHLLSLGSYPDLSLSDARDLRDEKRKVVKSGGDPKVVANHQPSNVNGLTFEVLAREWFELQKPMWVKRHADDVIESLEARVFPHIGSKHPDVISAPDVLKLLREIEKTAIETAKRVRQRISAVFVYGISSGRSSNDPAHIVKGALAPLRKGSRGGFDWSNARTFYACIMKDAKGRTFFSFRSRFKLFGRVFGCWIGWSYVAYDDENLQLKIAVISISK